MNKIFHQTAPVIALSIMPESFQKFLLDEGYTLDNLRTDADLPDMVDHDNITTNSEIHHAHSYKMAEVDGHLKWLDGDCLERLKGLCADAHDFKAENKPAELRYVLGKMTHYRVDSLTFPHLHRGQPWSKYHESFETEMGKFLAQHKDEIGEIKFEPYKDIYKSCRATAVDMWHRGLETVNRLEKGDHLTDAEKLEICRTCIKGIGDLWLTLANELKL